MISPPPDPGTFWLLVIISAVSLAVFLGWQVWHVSGYTKQQRLNLEAQRLMLRFCKHPTQQNFNMAWAFIADNSVWVSDLDQPLVRRFMSMAAMRGIN